MEEYLNLEAVTPLVKEGIYEIVEYERSVFGDEETDSRMFSNPKVESGILRILLGLACGDKDFLTDDFENVSSYVFDELGYDMEEAQAVLRRMHGLKKGDKEERFVEVLCEFDEVSRCIAKVKVYPLSLIWSLNYIEFWMDNGYCPSLELGMKYILSVYDCFLRADLYREELEAIDYRGCDEKGLPNTIEREIYSSRDMEELHEIFSRLKGDC